MCSVVVFIYNPTCLVCIVVRTWIDGYIFFTLNIFISISSDLFLFEMLFFLKLFSRKVNLYLQALATLVRQMNCTDSIVIDSLLHQIGNSRNWKVCIHILIYPHSPHSRNSILSKFIKVNVPLRFESTAELRLKS